MYDAANSPNKGTRNSGGNVNIMPAAFSNDSTQVASMISPKDPNRRFSLVNGGSMQIQNQ